MSALRPFNDNNMENPGVALICVSKAVWSVYAPFFFLSNAFFFFLSCSGPEQVQGSFRNQVLQSESCSMEQKSIIVKY